MKSKFYCQNCQKSFEAEGKKVDYFNPIYGPCWKRKALCLTCGNECDEHTQINSSKKNIDFDNYVNELRNKSGGGGCCGGGCCG